MSQSDRIRFNRSLFSAPLNGTGPVELVRQLAAEDIELVIDVRVGPSAESTSSFDRLCEAASMYYVTKPELAIDGSPTGEGRAQLTTWAAGLALRHHTCILGDADDVRLETSAEIAQAAGQRVIDLATAPARVALPPTV